MNPVGDCMVIPLEPVLSQQNNTDDDTFFQLTRTVSWETANNYPVKYQNTKNIYLGGQLENSMEENPSVLRV